MPSQHERQLLLHDGIFALLEDLQDQLRVVELQGESEGLGVTIELAEDLQGRGQEGRVVRLGHVWHAACQVQADAVEGSLGRIMKFFCYLKKIKCFV